MKKTYIKPTAEVYYLSTTTMLLIGSGPKSIDVDGTEEADEEYGGDARIHIESDGTNLEW